MALIKIRGRKEPVVVDAVRAREIKVMRFGRPDGTGAVSPKTSLDLGDAWAGTVGDVKQVEISTKAVNEGVRLVMTSSQTVKTVPPSYVLLKDESYIS